MIPLRDTIPSLRFPIVTILLIVVNSLIFFFEVSLGSSLNKFIYAFGMIPERYFNLTQHHWLSFLDRFYPFFTSIFLHGGWMHIIGNMWFLWIFGDNVEDRLGRKGFLLFYIFCGIVAGFTHAYTNPQSPVPTVGASGALAGVMGAYFIFFPRARVLTLIPIFIFIHFIEIPAYFYLGIWFLFQFLSGAVDLAIRSNTCSGVAWWAHIGGFVTGVLISLPFLKRRK